MRFSNKLLYFRTTVGCALSVLLKQLRHFLAVVDGGTVTEAARREELSQQAISKSIARLEAEFGAKLLERAGRGVTTTRLGDVVAEHARTVGSDVGRLRRAVAAELGLRRGRLVIGVSPIASLARIREVVMQFAESHPKLRIDVEAGIDRQFSSALHSGQIDLAIASSSETADRLIAVEPLFNEDWVVVGRRDHPLLSSATSLRDLREARWIFGRHLRSLGVNISAAFAESGNRSPKPQIVTTSVLFALDALAHSDYLSVLPASLVASKEGLIGQTFPACDWQTPVNLMRLRRVHLASGADEVIKALKQSVA